jgi:hypothetical protein
MKAEKKSGIRMRIQLMQRTFKSLDRTISQSKETAIELTDEENEVAQSAATTQQRAEALATEQALTEALETLQLAV